MDQEFEEAKEGMEALIETCRSAILGTAGQEGNPLASYAPVVWNSERRLYVYVSKLAKHYAQMKRSGRASAMLIEDESQAENLFARKRLAVDCQVSLIERGVAEWESGMRLLEQRHGDTVSYLKEMVDFDLFEMAPIEGRLVLGFGKAYRVFGEALSELGYVSTGKKGHQKN